MFSGSQKRIKTGNINYNNEIKISNLKLKLRVEKLVGMAGRLSADNIIDGILQHTNANCRPGF
jgi:nicotinamide mononucleotide (NMN) deamidase PncC